MEISITSGVSPKVLIRVKYRKKLSANLFNWSFFSTFALEIISYSPFLIRQSVCYALKISMFKSVGCGLMQESKDIQPSAPFGAPSHSCGLMQESKDIQQTASEKMSYLSCGLMQESKDIQLLTRSQRAIIRCGLMQESKDIQQPVADKSPVNVVV